MAQPNRPFADAIKDLPSPFVTVPELAAFLRIPKSSVYQLVKSGEIPYFQLGKRKTRISTRDVEHWLERNYHDAPGEQQSSVDGSE